MLIKLGPLVIATQREWEWFRTRRAGEHVTLTVECEDLASDKLDALIKKAERFQEVMPRSIG